MSIQLVGLVVGGMPWDSQETRRRLLEAAITEFSCYGIAGARGDRIASAAKANKQAIYAYFGSKEALFDAAYKDRIRDFHACVRFDEYDLAEYGGRMFDKFEDAPETLPTDPVVPSRKVRWVATRNHPRLERGQSSDE